MAASKQVEFLLVATLLFLLCLGSQAARPEPSESHGQPQIAEEEASIMETAREAEMDGCGGGEGMEECLMRRTLVAHTDYIYTQGKHN